MKIITKALRLNRDGYYLTHVRLINVLLSSPMTKKEVEVIAAFLAVEDKFKEEDEFSTYVRKIVKTKLGFSDGSLTNHIRSLKKKDIIVEGQYSGKLSIVNYIKPEKLGQGYQVKLILK